MNCEILNFNTLLLIFINEPIHELVKNFCGHHKNNQANIVDYNEHRTITIVFGLRGDFYASGLNH